ncbi:MAG: DUF1501 domain-containing protein [Planctomycetia bacterium]|nr:DUF1501 domain-containing protein [Planctomycetia bacterium]
MLTFNGNGSRFCNGVSRRDFLSAGAWAAGSLTLADLLRADSVPGAKPRAKSIINIALPGGPSHLDMFDLKPDAPAEVRGEFRPIQTVVPGFDICEHFGDLARVADRFAVVRSISDASNEHTNNQSDTGWPASSLASFGGRPGIGAVASKLLGRVGDCPVAAVSLTGHTSPGFLGQSLRDFNPGTAARQTLKLSMPESRLNDRSALLGSLDRFRREADASGAMKAMDRFTQDAIDVVTSPIFSDALESNREPVSSRERYGKDDMTRQMNEKILVARRLVEAGVRVVSFTWGGWDTHSANFTTLKRQLPMLGLGLTALIRDLEERGMLDDTIIMMSGEFGRTPRINGGAGRDHWPAASFVFVAGGGLRTGQFIGSTDRLGAKPAERPIQFQQVYATVYRQLGINVDTTQLMDPAGRPQYIVENREPISELI